MTAVSDPDSTPEWLNTQWALHPRVAIRPEPFGALAYHYDNRRLNFLRSPDLVSVVRLLSEHRSPRAAFDACGIEATRWPAFARALETLAASGVIVATTTAEKTPQPVAQ